MPIYEYRCPEDHTFELLQRFSDAAPESCAVCGAMPLEKVLSAPAVHFKGSGFYATDYGRKAPGKEADQAPKTAEGPDAKPAAVAAES